MILVDTSVWIDHFRSTNEGLQRVIEHDLLLCHPFVIGELALGSLRNRENVLKLLAAQRQATVATHDEVMLLISRHSIFSMGVGYTDAHLLASVLLDRRLKLWTRDKQLAVAAQKAGAELHVPEKAAN